MNKVYHVLGTEDIEPSTDPMNPSRTLQTLHCTHEMLSVYYCTVGECPAGEVAVLGIATFYIRGGAPPRLPQQPSIVTLSMFE